MSLIKQLVPSGLKFTPADASVNWTRIETLVHGPGAAPWGESRDADGNSAVFACLMTLCVAYTEAPLHVYRIDRQGKEKHLPDDPLQLLLNKPTPNAELTASELWFWTEWAVHVDGNAYWLKVRAGNDRTGNVTELWPISPTKMTPVSKDDEWISAYRWTYAPNKWRDVPVENIVHFRIGIDDDDHRKGRSPLKQLLSQVTTDGEADKFTATLLQNYAIPGLVVTPNEGLIDGPTAETMETKLGNKYSGENRGKVAVISKSAKVEQFGFSPEQMNLSILHRIPEERISAVLGVPAIVAGLGAGLDRATYANFKEAREMFTESKLAPRWRFNADRLNASLKPDFTSDDSIILKFDLTDIRAFQEDEDAKYARLNSAVQGTRPWITVNEARAEVGLPEVEGGDELIEPEPEPQPIPPPLQDFVGNGNGEEPDEEEQPKWYVIGRGDEHRLPFAVRRVNHLPFLASNST